MKKRLKAAVVAAISAVVVTATAFPVHAEVVDFDVRDFLQIVDETRTEIHAAESKTYNELFAEVDITRIDHEQTQKILDGLDQTAFGNLRFDIPVEVKSVSELNMMYAALSGSLYENGHHTEYTLDPVELQGYTKDINAAFDEVFPDKKVSVDEAKLPEGMTFEQMINTVKAARPNAVSQFKTQALYSDALALIGTKQYVPKMSARVSADELLSKAESSFSNIAPSDASFEEKKAAAFKALTDDHSYDFSKELKTYGKSGLATTFDGLKSAYTEQAESYSGSFNDMTQYVNVVFSSMSGTFEHVD